MRGGHGIGCVVQQRRGDDVLANPEVRLGELAELLGQRHEGVPVGPRLPWWRDGRVERVHERMHVGGVQVVLLIPRGGWQNDVGEDRGAGLAEVHREQQIELAGRGLLAPDHVTGPVGGGGLLRADGGIGAEQVLEEVLVALGRGAEQVGPPDPEDPREVLGVVGVLAGEAQIAALELGHHPVRGTLAVPRGLVGQREGVPVERRVGGHPAQPRGFRENVGGAHVGERAAGRSRGESIGAELVVAKLVSVQIPVGRLDHLPARAAPVRSGGQHRIAGDRADFLLPDVVGPAAAVHPLAPGDGGERQKGPIDGVGVEPMVCAGSHDDHGPTLGIDRVLRELPRYPRRGRAGHAGDLSLPGRRIRLGDVVVAGGPHARQAGPGHAVLGQQQIEHGGDQPAADLAHRHAAAHGRGGTVGGIEARQIDLDRREWAARDRQQRVDPAQVQVPFADAGVTVAMPERAIRHHRGARGIEQHRLEFGVFDAGLGWA